MKKTYIQPTMSVNEFQLEGLIAASSYKTLTIDAEGSIDTTEPNAQLGNKYNSPWSSTNWEN